MARTNKMWILKKKQQQAKQKKLMDDGSVADSESTIKRDFTNPKWNNYIRFLRWAKYFCDVTSFREDPDGFRLLRQANWWEINFLYKWEESWWFRRWRRKARKVSLK